jgi:hypothetical protein
MHLALMLLLLQPVQFLPLLLPYAASWLPSALPWLLPRG